MLLKSFLFLFFSFAIVFTGTFNANDCTYTSSEGQLYDFSPLRDVKIGFYFHEVIKDRSIDYDYYFQICGNVTNQNCPQGSAACQFDKYSNQPIGVYHSLGLNAVKHWEDNPINPSFGASVTFFGGDLGCYPQIKRTTTVFFTCGDEFGAIQGASGSTDYLTCHYKFLFTSRYACPIN